MGFLSDLTGGAEKDAAEQNRGLLMQNYLRGSTALNMGYDRSTGALNTGYDAARAAYQPLAALGTKYGGATTLGLDALGVNGPGGNTRATQAFQAGPGYQFALDQGNQAVERRRATSGMWDSGNTDMDLMKFGQGLANQEYGNWLNRLQGFVSPELAATSGAATGTAAAETGRGTGLAGLNTGYAENQVNMLNNLTSGYSQANNQAAAARSQGAQNVLSAGMGLANLAAGAAGGGGFGFGSLSSLLGTQNAGGYNVSQTGGVHPFYGYGV